MGSKKKPINSIHDLLEQYRELITNNRNKGTQFEILIKKYLLSDPIYANEYQQVWLWGEWPGKWGPDCGIDIVAQDFLGEYHAIQCKFYVPSYEVKKEDIDSFFTESGKKFKDPASKIKKSFIQRIIVCTSDNWSTNAQRSRADQTIPVKLLRVRDMEQSTIDWGRYSLDQPELLPLKPKKQLRAHQVNAIDAVMKGFLEQDRGKLVMACGTGKTFTALKIAEQFAHKDAVILFLVPSISLLSQTLREWTAEASSAFLALAVCSDTKVGKHQEDMSINDLAIPATTDCSSLLAAIKQKTPNTTWTVIFSTYQSIGVLGEAQKQGFPNFDLIICDEAHRTTGVTLVDTEDSHFVKVHSQEYIKGKKRLYMTATPRIYGDAAKSKANEAGAVICSMDDESFYGTEFYRLGFSEAVSSGLLSDYKVLVLAVDEKYATSTIQRAMANCDQEIELDDAVKIIGCSNGLAKRFISENTQADDQKPMRRAVAFSQTIKSSLAITRLFRELSLAHTENNNNIIKDLVCEIEHVDGGFNVLKRNEKLDWLKEDTGDENICRILSNARCLSEGVDVPALDAVLFLNPRNSIVDVVQSVGRIMRRAEGKKYGYVILPIGIPSGVSPEEALEDNKKYKVVWQVLQALRAHDDRFNAIINQIDINNAPPDQIQIIGVGGDSENGESSDNETEKGNDKNRYTARPLNFDGLEEWKDAIFAKIVLKCGDRRYWEDWAKDVAAIAEQHQQHIASVLASSEAAPKKAFKLFLESIHQNINAAVSDKEAIEMLAQHLITRPIFDALFENYSFAEQNPVSMALQKIVEAFDFKKASLNLSSLEGFYNSVRSRIRGVDNVEAKQKIITELYEKFFKIAFPKMTDKLGIVYTPLEVVDFVINSVEYALNKHLGMSLSQKDVHILDPFTGTGTFMVRLLQSGLIKAADLRRKYRDEMHANEIVLLAYYIAAINIEETFHSLDKEGYAPFKGIVLTDSFQLMEAASPKGLFDSTLPENNARAVEQKKQNVQVIISNPPYSAGQSDANDNNQNLKYPTLDAHIRSTYAAESTATNKNSLYDSYIRAIRMAADRIRDEGVIGFVTNGAFIDSNAADGLRKCLIKEFSIIYCFNLRGNARTSGEDRRKEKGNIFGEGSRTPVAITIFVKKPNHQGACVLKYHDIGDYLSRTEKLDIISGFKSIEHIVWQDITPNEEGDWINLRDPEFENFLELGSKEKDSNNTIFSTYSRGLESARDAWVYQFSVKKLSQNVGRMIEFYNKEVDRFNSFKLESEGKEHDIKIEDFINKNKKEISWSSSLISYLTRSRKSIYNKNNIVRSLYRPFSKQWLFFEGAMNHRVGQMPRLFPTPAQSNLVISVPGLGQKKPFSTFITDVVPDLNSNEAGGQCFPLYYYEPNAKNGFRQLDAITDWALEQFQTKYKIKNLRKEDIFYYIYGLLHSPDYRQKYAANFKKMLPRIPFTTDFMLYSKVGRDLAEWHLNYENSEPFALTETCKNPKLEPKKLYKVQQMKFTKIDKKTDKSTIIYNEHITLSGIPLETYDYIVNGKSALDWVIERYAISVDKDSGIENDPNDWSEDPRYIIDLVKRVVRVSLETIKIVNHLPPLEILN